MAARKHLDSLTVSVVAGCLARHAALATACREMIDGLTRHCRARRISLTLRVYTDLSPLEDSRFITTQGPARIVADEHFGRSDLIVYHFGAVDPLFDSIHAAPRTAKVAVLYQGLPRLAAVAEQEKPDVFAAYQQAVNLFAADQILAYGDSLKDELALMGLPPEKVAGIAASRETQGFLDNNVCDVLLADLKKTDDALRQAFAARRQNLLQSYGAAPVEPLAADGILARLAAVLAESPGPGLISEKPQGEVNFFKAA